MKKPKMMPKQSGNERSQAVMKGKEPSSQARVVSKHSAKKRILAVRQRKGSKQLGKDGSQAVRKGKQPSSQARTVSKRSAKKRVQESDM